MCAYVCACACVCVEMPTKHPCQNGPCPEEVKHDLIPNWADSAQSRPYASFVVIADSLKTAPYTARILRQWVASLVSWERFRCELHTFPPFSQEESGGEPLGSTENEPLPPRRCCTIVRCAWQTTWRAHLGESAWDAGRGRAGKRRGFHEKSKIGATREVRAEAKAKPRAAHGWQSRLRERMRQDTGGLSSASRRVAAPWQAQQASPRTSLARSAYIKSGKGGDTGAPFGGTGGNLPRTGDSPRPVHCRPELHLSGNSVGDAC